MENIQNIWIQILSKQKCFQSGAVFLNLFMMQHEYLVQSAHSPLIPGTLEVHSIRVTPDQVLGQDHDEPLEDNQEQVLLVSLGSLQSLFQLLHSFLRWLLNWPVAPVSFIVFIFTVTWRTLPPCPC